MTHAIGIDLGTTYSCLAVLNEHGQPTTIPNQEGELSTPSVVFFDDTEAIVGTEALRNAIAFPDRVIQNAKRFMGDPQKSWSIDGRVYTPQNVSTLVLNKLISAARQQLGPIDEAVITVPAQFSDAQRNATREAGITAGLKRVEMINEPVAAALCHVLGSEGLAFAELAIDQQLLVFDLGGGTLDLAIVSYSSNEVRVVASDGDLELGGLDWTQTLVDLAAEKFMEDFGNDPRSHPASHQFLALEAEQAKRSLSVRPRAAITVQHEGHRKTYQIELAEFVAACRNLLQRSEVVTKRILSDQGFGWAHVDVVLTTGGASRMPMIQNNLQSLSGRTLNSTLSPDQSIAHGAAYYAGMLMANRDQAQSVFNQQAADRLKGIQQKSVNARALGILIRNTTNGKKVPHYLIPANTPLPAQATRPFGTVVDHQTRVHVKIVESGAGPGKPHTILGDCMITDLPPNLPEGSEVDVTIRYDHEARVHVAATERRSGRSAEARLVRPENMSGQLQEPGSVEARAATESGDRRTDQSIAEADVAAEIASLSGQFQSLANDPLESEQPVALCNRCTEPLHRDGHCTHCGAKAKPKNGQGKRKPGKRTSQSKTSSPGKQATPKRRPGSKPGARKATGQKRPPKASKEVEAGEKDFWDFIE